MTNVFLLENTADFTEKINIDDLFEKKQKHDINTLALYNKLLNRIHVRIKTTARQKMTEQFCWYIIPEVMIGVPKYDQSACITYIMGKLADNKFNVRYIHPNTLFISWNHWVPTYVRNEIKSKTGLVLDEFGREKTGDTSGDFSSPPSQQPQTHGAGAESKSFSMTDGMMNKKTPKQPAKLFTPVEKYKPQGNLVYADELLEHVDFKLK